MTDPRNGNPRDPKRRKREAERVEHERRDDLPSQRDADSPESGRPPRGTQWERRGPTKPREY
jgi:hypothetical protein